MAVQDGRGIRYLPSKQLLMLNSKPICVEKMPCKDDLAQRVNIAALRRSDKVTKLRGLNRLPQQIRVETLMKFQLTKLLRKAEQMCGLTLIFRTCMRKKQKGLLSDCALQSD